MQPNVHLTDLLGNGSGLSSQERFRVKTCCHNLNKTFLYFSTFSGCALVCAHIVPYSQQDPQKDLWFDLRKPLETSPLTCAIILLYFRLLEWKKWVTSSKKPKTNPEQNKNPRPSWERPKNRCSYHLFVYYVFCGIQIEEVVSISLWN